MCFEQTDCCAWVGGVRCDTSEEGAKSKNCYQSSTKLSSLRSCCGICFSLSWVYCQPCSPKLNSRHVSQVCAQQYKHIYVRNFWVRILTVCRRKTRRTEHPPRFPHSQRKKRKQHDELRNEPESWKKYAYHLRSKPPAGVTDMLTCFSVTYTNGGLPESSSSPSRRYSRVVW